MKKSNFQFQNPYLEKLVFEVNENYESENEEVEMKNAFRTQIHRRKNENNAKVILTLESNVEKQDAPFSISISVASEFSWEEMDEVSVDSLLKVNAPALLLGYMRPIVANVTNSSKFPVYNLPFINFKNS